MKEKIEQRIKELVLERDLNFLEEVLDKYAQGYNGSPVRLEELVANGLIERIPPEPFGGYYYIDGETGEVKSSTHPQRLRIYR